MADNIENKLKSDYWVNKIKNKDILPLKVDRSLSTTTLYISNGDKAFFNKITGNRYTAELTILITLYRVLLERYFPGSPTAIYTLNHLEVHKDGNPLFIAINHQKEDTLKQSFQEGKAEIEEVYQYADYDLTSLENRLGFIGFNEVAQFGFSYTNNVAIESEQMPFQLMVTNRGLAGISISINFSKIFTEDGVAGHFLHNYRKLVMQLESYLQLPCKDIPLLSAVEKHQILCDFNQTRFDYPKDQTIISLFEDRVAKQPNHTASVFKGSSLTYSVLNETANRLAHYLKDYCAIGAGDIVIVLMPKSDNFLISVLAILKTGAAYLPLDLKYPDDRKNYILKDSMAKLVISDTGGTPTGIDTIYLDELKIDYLPATNLSQSIAPNDMAYVIYTSGSTGMPKGAIIEHAGNVNMSLDQIRKFNITETDRVVWFAAVAFDASISEMMMALYSGAVLLIPDEDTIIDQQKFKVFLKDSGATVVTFPPSYLDLLSIDDVKNLRCIITAGEVANVSKAREVAKYTHYFNAYGPTECAVCATTYQVSTADTNRVNIPIGKPIANLSVYILDEEMEPVPVGVAGMIYISGVGVGRGYLNNPTLTSEKFISDPFIPENRMYETGDLGKWLEDGNVVFLGRKDEQVKIRGYRIETGEIEHALFSTRSGLQQASVAVKVVKGQKVLVAYYVSATAINIPGWLKKLRRLLPEFMLPSFFVHLDRLPLTPNGKVNKNNLPNPVESDLVREDYLAPANDTEEKLIKIWQDILEVDRIGVNDDFFRLGGNSLMLTRVSSAIKAVFFVDIPIKTLFASATVSALSTEIHKKEQDVSVPSVVAVTKPAFIPLSFSQESLWLIDQIEGSSQYHVPILLKLEGDLDRNALEDAFSYLINRHEVLRTVIAQHENQAYQKIFPQNEWKLTDVDQNDKENFINLELGRSFDLSTDHLIRASLLKLTQHEYQLLIVMHHIVSDGWSMVIFIDELIAVYNAIKAGQAVMLPELAIQYADYAIWQRNYLSGPVLDHKLLYWKEQLKDLSPLNLPTDFIPLPVKNIAGRSLNFKIQKELCEALTALSIKEGVTLYMTLLAVFKVLLYRYTGHTDICVGSPTANRTGKEVETLIGFFVNTIALRSDLSGNPIFTDLLASVKNTTIDGFANQDVPFEKVLNSIKNDGDTAHESLFQSLFVFQNNQIITASKIGEVSFSLQELEQKTVKFDLTLSIAENLSGLDVSIQYRSNLFLPETILRMKGHFQMLLSSIVNDPSQRIGHIQMLQPEEQSELLANKNSEIKKAQPNTILTLFKAQVEKVPDEIAVVFEEKKITYRQIDKTSDQLAGYLSMQELNSGELILLCIADTLELTITGMLGIIKAGAAYVPLDADYPAERVNFIIKDTNAKILVCNKAAAHLFIDSGLLIVIIEEMHSQPATAVRNNLIADDLIYVIYTSGSTGNPKGVMVTHGNIIDYLSGIFSKLSLAANRSYGLMSTISTDLGNTVLFSAITSGASLHLFSKDMLSMPGSMQRYFREHSIDCIKIVPSYWKSMDTEAGFLYPSKMIIFGGEELSGEIIRLINDQRPDVRVINHYGPTETTIGKLLYETNPAENCHTVPIGDVFSDSVVYIVDRDFSLCPLGIAGELLIGGKGVAKGYVNNPVLTGEKFINNPFNPADTNKVYRTGDLVQRLPNGGILFMGRVDQQIKIRGYRVEPGEIVTHLLQSGTVNQCIVTDSDDALGNKQLVAYLTVKDTYSRSTLIAYLKERLPAYMLPSIFVEVDHIPLTSNGKVNRRLLPDVTAVNVVQEAYRPPETETELLLADIWKALLNREKISVNDNFFECGGNSLIALRLINKIEQQLEVKITLRDVFSNKDIFHLAQFVASKEQQKYSRINKVPLADDYELSSNQLRLWLACQYPENATAYNITGGLLIEGELNISALKEAYLLLTARHESLRTVFINDEQGLPRQKILDEADPYFNVIQKNGIPDESVCFSLIEYENAKSFSMVNALLTRVEIYTFNNHTAMLVVAMHHLISDGWSMDIFIHDWITIYQAITAKETIKLPALGIQYKDFAAWQKKYLESPQFEESIAYWKSRLGGNIPVLNLPLSFNREENNKADGEGFVFSVEDRLYEKLKQLAAAHQTSLFAVLFTAFNVLLHHISNQNEIILGTSTAGRRHADLESIIGFFVNTLAIKTTINTEESFGELLTGTAEQVLLDFAHQDMPFDQLITSLDYKRQVGLNPVFQARFVMNDDNEHAHSALQELNFKTTKIIPKEINSKFDFSLVMRKGRNLTGVFEYKYALFKKETIQAVVTGYMQLLEDITLNPDQSIKELNRYDALVSENKKANRTNTHKNNLKMLINTAPKRINS
ncbi:amino acid adenylation domain-containing protein [Pedobacter psychrotolerans]|uniref:Amino acid adenylation domain-containing protein n=1 Tax=Pedobacter psychrotolerans TaxID=1843235 RepID=A0A4R2HC10_9SPHI|nr:non-ribosomal peptide synthetase [Pedobacter psychrotolerans]TCO25228.1 amino acid adenylation domain-containing protein [Pedobacter psychrotolerans]GGE47094.1 hypothetical protein GCM10011413_11510 [Pedobacter psychrotolerans]